LQVITEGDGDTGGLLGNTQGFLCFGMDLLRAAHIEPDPKDGNLALDPSSIFDPHSALIVKWLCRKEELDPILSVSQPVAKFILALVIALLLATLALAAIGLASITSWVMT
jgi:hypothetical protein